MKGLLASSCVVLSVNAGPAKDYLSNLQATAPLSPPDPMVWAQDIIARMPPARAGVPKVMIVGDSWADIVGMGGNESFFEQKLVEHGCEVSSLCVAIPGSTASFWAGNLFLDALKLAIKAYKPDFVWGTLVGNDALDSMPDCASTGKSEVECADELMATAVPNVLKLVDAIHEAAPAAKITGFGYDTMFGGPGCGLLTRDIFPQCWGKDRPRGSGNRCFNTQFLRIQDGWGYVAGNRSFVDPVSILGATQVAAGDEKASTDDNDRHIDMDKMGPAKYWPTYLACFHPGITGDDDSGAMVVMEEFYREYWSKQPAVCSASIAV